jgi:hypothetical protein
MGTATLGLPPLPDAAEASWSAPLKPQSSRHRLASVCQSPECPYRGKLWPAWLRIVSPIQFEGRFYCDTNCLTPVLNARIQRLQTGFVDVKRKPHRMPLGLVLLQRGALSQAQLREALRLQREAGRGRIGYWLRELGAVDEQNLTAALAQQYGCPVFPLERMPSPMLLSDLIPLTLLETSRFVPAHSASNGNVLYLAFGDRVDHSTLFAIEQMLGRQTVGCVSREAVVNEILESFRNAGPRHEIRFESVRQAGEMTGAICNYARELEADRVAVVNTSSYVWARFHRKESVRDLLFKMLP